MTDGEGIVLFLKQEVSKHLSPLTLWVGVFVGVHILEGTLEAVR